jgi:hypothetical protein
MGGRAQCDEHIVPVLEHDVKVAGTDPPSPAVQACPCQLEQSGVDSDVKVCMNPPQMHVQTLLDCKQEPPEPPTPPALETSTLVPQAASNATTAPAKTRRRGESGKEKLITSPFRRKSAQPSRPHVHQQRTGHRLVMRRQRCRSKDDSFSAVAILGKPSLGHRSLPWVSAACAAHRKGRADVGPIDRCAGAIERSTGTIERSTAAIDRSAWAIDPGPRETCPDAGAISPDLGAIVAGRGAISPALGSIEPGSAPIAPDTETIAGDAKAIAGGPGATFPGAETIEPAPDAIASGTDVVRGSLTRCRKDTPRPSRTGSPRPCEARRRSA